MKTIFLFLLSSTYLFAQSKVAVAPTYWYNYSNYSYQVHSVYDGSDSKSSGHGTASSIGLSVQYNFSQKWNLSVGLLYNKGKSYLTTPQYNDLKVSNEYIQLPVLLSYRLSEKRLSPYFSAGVLLEKNKGYSNSTVKVNSIVGVGLDYKISSKISWMIQPTASYFLSKPANTALYQFTDYRSYRIGLQTQLMFHF